MIKIAISIGNRIFSESIMMMLQKTGDFKTFLISTDSNDEIINECISIKPDLCFFDVKPYPESKNIDNRLKAMKKIKDVCPEMKTAVLCDEVAFPELAENVMRMKQTGQINAFYYTSVSADYLIASLYSV